MTITIVARVNLGTAGQTISNQGVASYDINGDGLDDTGFLTDDPATPAVGDPTNVLALALTGAALLLLRRRRTT